MKIPPILIEVGPVSAKVTGTTEPTERWLVLAVVVSMSSMPSASDFAEAPEVMLRMTVEDRSDGASELRVASDRLISNCPLLTLVTRVTPGTAATASVAPRLNPVSEPPVAGAVMM